MKKFCKEYLALQNRKKYLFCAWKLSLSKGNYAVFLSVKDYEKTLLSLTQ